jgi:hypothetical protein
VQGEVEVVIQVGSHVVVDSQLHPEAVSVVEHHEPSAVVLDGSHHLEVGLRLVLLARLAQRGVVACGKVGEKVRQKGGLRERGERWVARVV